MIRLLVAMLTAILFSATTASAQLAPPSPNLGQPWNSQFGPINFQEGIYDFVNTESKLIQGSLTLEGNSWVYNGTWGRDGSPNKYPLKFVFADDGLSFQGTYETKTGEKKAWNGGPPIDLSNRTLAEPAEPELRGVIWESDFGQINFAEGWYGNRGRKIRGRIEQSGRYNEFVGQWGREGSDEWHDLRFRFSEDGRSFIGWYLSANGERKDWAGQRR